jgi:thiol-disulfide isomerase/thioredoxin
MKTKIIIVLCLFFVSGIISAQDKPESAAKILDDAYKIAGKEKKSVMIVFHASWCGWCKKFESSINDSTCKDFFDKHFVIRYLDILERGDKKIIENPGAEDIYNKNGGNGGGIPFFLIYDKNKNLLADSKFKASGDGPDKAAQNIGCPASEEEVVAFIKILEKSAKISVKEKTAIMERFKKNKS